MEGALRVFNKMPSCDVVSWTVIISGHVCQMWERGRGFESVQ
jgi:hypothetical protein